MVMIEGIGWNLKAMLSPNRTTFEEGGHGVCLARRKRAFTTFKAVDVVLVDAFRPVPKHLVAGIIDSIKNKLLDFILDLQKASGGAESDNWEDSLATKRFRNLFNVNIYGSHNVIASGENVVQTLNSSKAKRF